MASQDTGNKNKPSGPPTVPLRLRLQLALQLPFVLLRGVFQPANKHRSWRAAARWSALRHLTGRSWRTPQEMAAVLGPSTGGTYASWAKGAKVGVTTEAIEGEPEGSGQGAKLHWVGDKTLGKVVLYFHGGGFVFGPTEGTFAALYALKEDLKPAAGDVGFAALEYSFVPDAPFPTQLAQATAALTHLIALGVSPASIVLAGDSAGGNLVLQVLSHLLHPSTHPSVPPPPKLPAPLGGALLISPWGYAAVARACTPGVTDELRAYVEPARAPAGWWAGLAGGVRRVLATAGEKECLLDMVLRLGEALKAAEGEGEGAAATRVFVEEGGVHEQVLFEFTVGEGRRGKSYGEILGWLKEGYGGGEGA